MSTPARKISFQGGGDFADDVRTKVNLYIAQPGVKETAFRELHRKAAIIVAWVVCSYAALLFLPHSLAQVLLCGASLVLAQAAVQFNIMHDGNHGAFSKNKRANYLAGLALDIAGGFSPYWQMKHNVSHHGYPNVVDYDDDIDQPPFARFAYAQPWRRWYRWQHWYIWPVYGLMLFRWLTVGDLLTLARGRVGPFELRQLSIQQRLQLTVTKLLAIGWQLALPLTLNWSWHGGLLVLAVYACLTWALSCLITIVFQLAHCVDETLFVTPEDADENGKMSSYWMVGQVLATQDFCPDNQYVRWYVGGLNYQIEHHLFQHLPHTLYPAIAPIVQEMCYRHGVKYTVQTSLRATLGSHFRHLRNMAQPPAHESLGTTTS